jgi:RNA polymerase sigma-70 factor (ECF subfamily)
MTMTEAAPTLDLAGLMREYQAGVWRYLRALGADTSTADDVAQEVFLAAMRSGFVERSRGETISWLRLTSRNQYLKHVRRNGREVAVNEVEALDRRYTELAGEDDGEALVNALRECMKQVEEKPRSALEMQHSKGLQRAEIAKQLGMTDDGVNTLLARTTKRLRMCMDLKLR